MSKDILHRLGRGERIADLCASLGWTRERFDAWWKDECARRVPAMSGSLGCKGLGGEARIGRDAWGIPHIRADKEHDLFFGYGFATAQDRLFQLDFMRRKARGRLAEILGPEAVESDLLHRTIDLAGIAEREWASLPGEVRSLLSAYTAGINAFMQGAGALPIEFDLLDYRPEAWREPDSLAILGEFRWYLTGRFPVIVIPELVKRALGDGPLYRDFLESELDSESILHAGEYPAARHAGASSGTSGEGGPGSNNWVLAGTRTASGKPLVASDPHIPFQAVSIWHEAHLEGGRFKVVGVALAGVPAIMIGRNENVAWGITNNICSQRDLYLEKVDPAHPDSFLYHDAWERAGAREETIGVRDAAPVKKVIRSSRHGPIVNEVLPPLARGLGPVSLRWLGFEPCGWLTAMLGMNRAGTAMELREATRPWLVPTFSLVYADREGHIGYHAAGRIPIRNVPERGFRPGWDPRHEWAGTIPFEEMPRLYDPARGHVVTANNRVAPDDFPYPLSGTWASGCRAQRCRELVATGPKTAVEDHRAYQLDCLSPRAVTGTPALVAALKGDDDPRVRSALGYLDAWDGRMRADSVATALFNVFFAQWCKAVCRERLPEASADFIAALSPGLSGRLLHEDRVGWFGAGRREQAIRAAFRAALDELRERIGPDIDTWRWGALHILLQKHFLSGRGDLGLLLDLSGLPCDGDGSCICSGQTDAQHMSYLGAGYRMVADLADPGCGIWSVEVAGVSGHPGSPHYADQIEPWSEGKCHYLPLTGGQDHSSDLTLRPGP